MAVKKLSFLILCSTLSMAGIVYAIIHRKSTQREHALSQSIALLDLSGLPDTFRSKLIAAERSVRKQRPSQGSILELARLYHANGFYDEAESRYRILLGIEDQSTRAKAHYYIATIRKSLSDFDAAVAHLTATIELEPDYLPAHLNLAEIHYKSGNISESVASFQAVLNLDPAHPYALLGLARERIQLNDDAMALTHLETLTRADPNFTNGASLLAQVLERNGQSKKAALMRKKIVAGWDLPPEDPWMDETMQLCYDTQRLSIFFEDYKRVGQIERAMTYLDRIEAVDADNWNCHLMRAYTYVELKKHEKSIPYFIQALDLGGDPGTIYPFLAKTYFEMTRYQEAENMARKGLELSPNNTEALVTMAGIHLQNNEPKNAISLFQKTLSIDPYHLLANTVLAKYHWQTGDRTTASNYLKTIQKVESSDLFSRVFLGQYYLESNRPFDALPPLEQAFDIDPNDEYVRIMLPDAYATIGNVQREKGAFKEALESYGKALAIAADHAAAKEGKASLLKKLTGAN